MRVTVDGFPLADGRERSEWQGPLTDSDADARTYLEADPQRLRVYRCLGCQVRVANEADLCRAASLQRGLLIATFRQTFNLEQHEGFVACRRCGRAQFPYDDFDEHMLTVPLYWDGARTFDKTPARCFVVVDADASERQGSDDGDELDESGDAPHPAIAAADAFRDAVVAHSPHWDCEVTLACRLPATPSSGAEALTSHFQVVMSPDDPDALAAQPTPDLCVLLKLARRQPTPLKWTDAPGHAHAPALRALWRLGGGSLVFGDWHVPAGLPAGGALSAADMEHVARSVDAADRQPALAQLIRDGQWLGWWPADHAAPPERAAELAGRALRSDLLYPHWLFARDMPGAAEDATGDAFSFQFSAREMSSGKRPEHRAAPPPPPESSCSIA